MDLFHSAERTDSNQYDIVYRIFFTMILKGFFHGRDFQTFKLMGITQMNEYDENSRRLIVVAEADAVSWQD